MILSCQDVVLFALPPVKKNKVSMTILAILETLDAVEGIL